ncbi:MBL fold metallo-hydrolase [Gordonia sp. TBRC 11910]|uniref:MBL fold metallo-hydrolase n=1 Tax=Gordonia asplenii TaxID=2725283 RepID=A0A848KYD5_9ACTN|nr:MBL fold metallo-hydrolase [Gordonia asplenii]NMO01433.1 MBL fold metallo-hydrolase [Gordonia asplenii]
MTTASQQYSQLLADDVRHIPLPLPLPDLREINCFAIIGPSGITLIDPGWNDEPSEHAIRRALSELDATPADVEQIFVTHSHWDHYTRALEWQQRHGIPVYLGREEHHTIDAFDMSHGPYPHQAALLRRCGATELADAVDRLELEDFETEQPFGPPDQWIADRQEFACGAYRLRSHWTPGHTRGHTVYELVDTPLLFTGDHLLPRITPSLGFEHIPEDSPLTSYLASLRKFVDAADGLMLPAHGSTSFATQPRAAELLEHHRLRLSEIRDLVAAGHTTAFAVAEQMRWTRHARTISDLAPLHAMTAVLEVRSHLQHLVREGELSVVEDEVQRYQA